jgi:hypothetical protein
MKTVNVPFSKFVLPIDKKVFRIHILKCLSFQLLLISVVYIILQNRESNIELFQYRWKDYSIAWIANLLMLIFVYDINLFRARFKDIYPDHELNKIFYFFAGFVPVFFVAMVIFLCVKNSDSGDSYPRAFRKRYALLGLLPLLTLQGHFPVVSFWTASSSSYYLLDTLQQFEKMEEKKKVPSIEKALAERPGAVTVMALIWKAGVDLKDSKVRTIASEYGTYNDVFNDGFKFLNTCHQAIILSEDNSIRLTDFSPIQWLHPSGPVDIVLTKIMDQGLREKTAEQLLFRCFHILENMENRFDNLRLKNADYKKEMADLRMKFYRTRTFADDAISTYQWHAKNSSKK